MLGGIELPRPDDLACRCGAHGFGDRRSVASAFAADAAIFHLDVIGRQIGETGELGACILRGAHDGGTHTHRR